MSDFSDSIDQLFRDLLERHEKNPGKDVWEEIDKTLNRDDRLRKFREARKGIGMVSVLLFLIFCVPLSLDKALLKNFGLFNLPASKSKLETVLLPVIPNTIAYAPPTISPAQIPISRKNKNVFFTSDHLGTFIISDNRGYSFESKILNDLPENRSKGILSEIKSGYESGHVKTVTHVQTNIRSRFSVTPYYSKDFAGYNFIDHDIIGINGKEIESRERNIFAASAGIYLNYRVSRKWVIQSGISYSWSNNNIDSANSYAVKNDDGIIQFKFNTTSGYSYLKSPGTLTPVQGDSVSTAQTSTQLRHLTIPILLSYRIPFGRFSILAGGGFTINVLTRAALQTVIYGHGYEEYESEIAIHGLKKVNIGLLLKAELEYCFGNRWAVEVIPSFRNRLSPVNLNSTVPAYPYNFGMGIGVQFPF